MPHHPTLSDEEFLRRKAIVDESMRVRIAQEGWAVMGVFDPDGEQDLFLYTVGLTANDLPELLMVDVPAEHREYAAELLNYAAETHLHQALTEDDVLDLEDINGTTHSMRVRQADPLDPRHPLSFAKGLYGLKVRALLLDPILDTP